MKSTKKLAIMATTALCALVLVACGGNDKKTETSSSAESSSEKKVTKKESKKKVDSSSKESGSEEFDKIVAGIKENLDAKEIKVLYADMKPQVFEQGTVTVSLDGYETLELNDFKQDFASSFRDNSDYAGLLLAKYTIVNTGKEDAYYSPIFGLDYSESKYPFSARTKNIMSEDVPSLNGTLYEQKNKVTPGESVTGFLAFTIDGPSLDDMKKLAMVTMTIPAAYSKDEISKEARLGEEVKIELPVTDKGEETIAEKAKFYPDKITVDNMGTKTLLKEKKDIAETADYGEAKVTFNGYQFTEFVPNETEAPRFSDFENGIVLMTASFTIKNDGDEIIAPSTSSATLNVNNDSQRIMNSGMLLPRTTDTEIKKGEEKEWIQVFAFDKEQYDKIWKDKDFSIKVNLRQISGSLRKGEDVTFKLPK
ncbi:conserved exported hypothetical protein [Carnobacterium maltaromaticum]|uniref:DUF5068 domain-containing protein n=1 Tax=Carnobacterium maltaromaticum TaxID=2751 RepID=UPI00191BAD7C|nr:DUF5068 domain-containing protein [Carnobacterium maltaromaticum]CAD5902801.1 conserved exported hypothetical protein [Carnobacterium maltaromaticum]